MIVILCGKSASGKDTIAQELIEKFEYNRILSETTRPMRDGEIEGKEYNFIPENIFLSRIKNNKYIEYKIYEAINDKTGETETWYYGTPKKELNPSQTYITIKDPLGVQELQNYYGKENCLVFYINTNDKIRFERVQKRGSFNLQEWNKRLTSDNEKLEMIQKILTEMEYVEIENPWIEGWNLLEIRTNETVHSLGISSDIISFDGKFYKATDSVEEIGDLMRNTIE